ncbi:protease complex subunit PrcB family protein [Flavobacterium sp. N3904]|uniref:protease complex subunit PrcB family protein n=1 Tax=Flavobacterium sp. N3904 TaxID=2986835 RepID=UPI0022246842|nr:protease complex subunit PrcB family protein [Flavobacterium sp. N3904]
MKKIILVLFIAFGFYSCTDTPDYNTPNCGNVTNLAYESFSYCGTLKESPKQPVFVVLNSKEEFDKIFTSCPTFAAIDFPDFTQKRILGLFAGPKPTSGYSIKIQSVKQDDCQIVVEFFETELTGDAVTPTVTYPADYIVIPKSSKPIFFQKVNQIKDYVVIGTYFGLCSGTDCQQFYKIDSQKVLHYLKVNYGSYDFNQYGFKTLVYKDDLATFLQKIPTEITTLKGQTKTFGEPDSHDQGGVYFEWNQGGVITKIYLDTDNTTDQSQNVILFKKAIQDKIAELKTKS